MDRTVLCMDSSSLPRVALTWALERKCKRGRPKETRRRTVEWFQLLGVEEGLAAANRVSWRSSTSSPYSPYREGTDVENHREWLPSLPTHRLML